MRKVKTFLIVMTAMVMLLGCSEEKDCATCPPLATADWLTLTGAAYLNADDLTFDCRLSRPGGVTVEDIDSILVEGRLVDLQNLYLSVFPTVYGHLYYPNSPFSSGDAVTIAVYSDEGSAQCRVTLFGSPDDAVEFVDRLPYPEIDTVAPGTEIVVRWHSVPDADGYTCRLAYEYDSSGTQWREFDEVVADTVFTISADESAFEGVWRIWVAAYREPNTGTCGQNFCGEGSVTGSVISVTNETRIQINVDASASESLQSSKLPPVERPEIDYLRLVEQMHE